MLLSGFYDARIIECARLDIDVVRMFWRRGEQGGAARWTEVAGQFTSAVGLFRKPFGIAGDNTKVREAKTNTDIERATRTPATVFAMAVIRGTNRAYIFISDVAAEAPPAASARHRPSPSDGFKPRRVTDQASAALKGAAECAGPEKVNARQYSGNWNSALQRPTACRCYAAPCNRLRKQTMRSASSYPSA